MFGALLTSRLTKRAPGRSTRKISRRVASTSTTLRSEKPIVAPSKARSSKGIAMTSPSTNAYVAARLARRARRCARSSIGATEIDAGDAAASGRCEARPKTKSPVPQQRSRTRPARRRSEQLDRSAAPTLVEAGGHHPIGEIVARRDSREHLATKAPFAVESIAVTAASKCRRRSPP